MNRYIYAAFVLILLNGCGDNFKKNDKDTIFLKEDKKSNPEISKHHRKTVKTPHKEVIKKVLPQKKQEKGGLNFHRTPEPIVLKDEILLIEGSGIDFKIEINKKDVELIKIVENIRAVYLNNKISIENYYSNKKVEINNTFNITLQNAKNTIDDINLKYKDECFLFTSKNIDRCNEMKNKKEMSENIIYKDSTELDRVIKNIERLEIKELGAIKISFQKNILNAKESFILSR